MISNDFNVKSAYKEAFLSEKAAYNGIHWDAATRTGAGLRAGHERLMMYLIDIARQRVPEANLLINPTVSFTAYLGELSYKASTTSRTVQSHLSRLAKAKLIAFHPSGRNGITITLNPEMLITHECNKYGQKKNMACGEKAAAALKKHSNMYTLNTSQSHTLLSTKDLRPYYIYSITYNNNRDKIENYKNKKWSVDKSACSKMSNDVNYAELPAGAFEPLPQLAPERSVCQGHGEQVQGSCPEMAQMQPDVSLHVNTEGKDCCPIASDFSPEASEAEGKEPETSSPQCERFAAGPEIGLIVPLNCAPEIQKNSEAQKETESKQSLIQKIIALKGKEEAEQAETIRRNMPHIKRWYANQVMDIAMGSIFSGRIYDAVVNAANIYPAERALAVDRIEASVFSGPADLSGVKKAFTQAKERLKLADSHIRRMIEEGRWKSMGMTPSSYFSPTNKLGFAGTKAWAAANAQRAAAKKQRRDAAAAKQAETAKWLQGVIASIPVHAESQQVLIAGKYEFSDLINLFAALRMRGLEHMFGLVRCEIGMDKAFYESQLLPAVEKKIAVERYKASLVQKK